MTKEILFLIFFILIFGGCLAVGAVDEIIERIKYRKAQKVWLQKAAERKWRAEFFERYRREIAEEDKP